MQDHGFTVFDALNHRPNRLAFDGYGDVFLVVGLSRTDNGNRESGFLEGIQKDQFGSGFILAIGAETISPRSQFVDQG